MTMAESRQHHKDTAVRASSGADHPRGAIDATLGRSLVANRGASGSLHRSIR